jgi:hypothetical protein
MSSKLMIVMTGKNQAAAAIALRAARIPGLLYEPATA